MHFMKVLVIGAAGKSGRALVRTEMKDKAARQGIVDASGLDWIIVRSPFLNDDPGTGNSCNLQPSKEQIETPCL
jgi:hypothetical protein